MLTEAQRKKVFGIIIINQCLGMVTVALFQNGFYLNYFSRLGLSSSAIALLLALHPLISTPLLLPFAYYSDRFGKKAMALFGQAAVVTSLLVMMAAGWGLPFSPFATVVTALMCYGFGQALQAASWFALLNPIIPPSIRGRFFGRLRVTFQTVAVLFTLLIARLLNISEAMPIFQGLLAAVLIGSILRFFSYARIPELENPRGETDHRQSFFAALASLVRVPGYMAFNGYVFLITLFTAAVPIIFGLMQKDVFVFTPSMITMMGNLLIIGSVIGCAVGGRLVDKKGTRFVILVSQLAYAAVMLLMMGRHWMPWSLTIHAGLCSLAYGLIGALCGLAFTSETLALIPARNKSLSTAMTMTLFSGGSSMAGIFVSWAIDWQLFSGTWQAMGRTFTVYDTMLLGFAMLVLTMPAAIGLVPRIMNRSQRFPGGLFPRL